MTVLIARTQLRSETPLVSLKDAGAALAALMTKAGGGGVRCPVMAATLTGFLITRRT